MSKLVERLRAVAEVIQRFDEPATALVRSFTTSSSFISAGGSLVGESVQIRSWGQDPD